ncbi:MAG: hypothetical protein RLZZ488_625 [Pseudomonadota bacterium]
MQTSVDKSDRKRIVVAGASGFVGMDLLRRLSNNHQVIALTRSPHAAPEPPEHHESGVYWIQCNLFSLKQTESALHGADAAYFLVHSMSPSARLTQGEYDNLDLFIADNFSRAAAKAGVQRIIYLGGIQPTGNFLSSHLRSRLEVERVLQRRCNNTVALRAGLILGPGGSSSLILVRLIQRLPVLVCPSWTGKMSSPVALRDAVDALVAALDLIKVAAGSYDLAGPETISYRNLMRRTANEMNLRRFFIPFIGVPPQLSRLWVSLVTGAKRELVSPLIQSLLVDMLPGRTAPVFSTTQSKIPLMAALHQAEMPRVKLEIGHQSIAPVAAPLREDNVVSIQRMPLPTDWTALSVAQDYAHWLPQFLLPLLKLRLSADGSIVGFYLRGWSHPLLELEFMPDRSDAERALFIVRRGLLRKENSNPLSRLEFRVIAHQRLVLAAVLDFVPSLPWPMYVLSQALAHRFVMWRFSARLRKISLKQPHLK